MLITTFAKEFCTNKMVQPNNGAAFCIVDYRREGKQTKQTEKKKRKYTGVKTLNKNVC